MDLGELKVLEFRAAVLRLYLRIALLASIAVIPTYYFVGIDLLFGVCIGFAVTVGATMLLFRRGRIGLASASRLFLLALVLACMAGLVLGNELIDNKPWQLLVPIAVFTLLGSHEARVWTLGCLLVAGAILGLRGDAYMLISSAAFVVAYATLVVAMDVFTRHNELNIRTIARLSHTDPLTGVFNRQLFDELSRNEMNRAKRAEEELAVYMIDIDHFKKFNDRYGHVAGDRALADVASVIRTRARRASDLVFRYGGEEFCVISSALDCDAAMLLAENILDGVRALRIPHALGEGGRLTVSVGLSHHEFLGGESVQEIVQHADAALYEAKARGRDCLVQSPFDAVRPDDYLSAEA